MPPDSNYVGALAEYCVRQHLAPPHYDITGDGPDFDCHVTAAGLTASSNGLGKQTARRNAAQALLAILRSTTA
jgi:hypothetical protein